VYANWETIRWLCPEIVLLFMATWIYVAGTFQQTRWWWVVFSVVVYGSVGFMLTWSGSNSDGVVSLNGPLISDRLADALRWLALLVGALLSLVTATDVRRELASELLATLMLLVAGLMLVCRANDLVLLFVSLELVSIPTYVMLYLGRRERSTSEATAKYFFLSLISSSLLLYGMTLLYGVAGTTMIIGSGAQGIRGVLTSAALAQSELLSLAPLALVLMLAGLSFKIAAVPFHFYAPDVYQGATNANAGLLAVAPKMAGIVALVRLLVAALPSVSEFAWQLVLVLALLTMTLGNVCALWQQNVRRLLAYSSIAHAGYMLIGLAVALATAGTPMASTGTAAMLFYLIVYVFASLGAFAALAALSNREREVSGLEELAGLGRTQPVLAAALAVCMFSLAGIPPLAGFWGKFSLFTSALGVASESPGSSQAAWFVVLAVSGALNAAIAAAYYLRVVAVLYFQATRVELTPGRGLARVAAVAATLVVLVVGVSPRAVENATRGAGDSGLQLAEPSAELVWRVDGRDRARVSPEMNESPP